MSRERSVKQLVLMSEGRYLSTDTGSMALRLVSYNADSKSLAYVQYNFQWQESGLIVGSRPLILALPVLPYSSYASDRCAKYCMLVLPPVHPDPEGSTCCKHYASDTPSLRVSCIVSEYAFRSQTYSTIRPPQAHTIVVVRSTRGIAASCATV